MMTGCISLILSYKGEAKIGRRPRVGLLHVSRGATGGQGVHRRHYRRGRGW